MIGVAVVAVFALLILLPGFYGGEPDAEEGAETTDVADTEATDTEATDTEATDTEAADAADTEAADTEGSEATDESTEEAAPNLDTTEGREVKDGDTVNIDYTGYKDGEPFDGGSTNGAGADLTIGSHSYIDGFESGLIGKKVGETVDLNLTFPEDYGVEDLAGADVVFTVTINGIYNE
ncbi:MAG: FKBP-type peptidyl-prolyl cis-trans isomerase [Lachnospiraceae bacterium]|nr:FKBP-type peptidyl-prolyl cis-trans isomerase [Lachnospiraceae bacterium]